MCHILFYKSLSCVTIILAGCSYHSTHLFYFLELSHYHWEDNDFLNLCCMRETHFYLCISMQCFIQNESIFYACKCMQWCVCWHGCLPQKKKFKRLYTHYPFLHGPTVPQTITDCGTWHSCMQPINCPCLVPQLYYSFSDVLFYIQEKCLTQRPYPSVYSSVCLWPSISD